MKNLDLYIWLEKDSKKRDMWLNNQQKETADYFSKSKIRPVLKKRFKKLFNVDSMGTPVIRGKVYFFAYRKPKEEDYSVYMQKGQKGKPILLINMNKLRKRVGVLMNWYVSKDAKLIALEFSKAGNDKFEIRIFDIENKKFLKNEIIKNNYPCFGFWNGDGSGFWYIRGADGRKVGDEKYFKHIYFHRLGEKISDDKVFFKKDLKKEDWPDIKLSHDDKYILISVWGKDRTAKIFFRYLHVPEPRFIEITKGMKAESFATVHNGYIYMETNYKSPYSKILRRKILEDKLGNWSVFIPERKKKINNWSFVSDYLILEYLVDVSSKFLAIRIKDKKIKNIKLPGIGSVGEISTEFAAKEFFFTFSSFNIPPTIYRIGSKDFKPRIFWESSTPAHTNDLIVKQEWYRSKDGTRVPMFIVYKKGIRFNRDNPTLVYAYGGFGASITPGFWNSAIPLLENGGVFVVVNIRGGGELGDRWHKGAILKNKHKSFDDFSYALKYLVKRKYTNPNKIAIWGISNGGLLMSVMLTQYHKQFGVAVVEAAVTDMLRYHLFDGGRRWIAEYGDPDDKKMRPYLLKYSPYHNIKNLSYPSVIFITSGQDDRVNPMHSYKMVARLKDVRVNNNPILLRLEKDAGHGGANKISTIVEELTDTLAFIYKQLEV